LFLFLRLLYQILKKYEMKIGITNLKGGVGKTTIAQNLAVCFAHMGFKTCIVDTDENQNSLVWSGVRSSDLPDIMVVGVIDINALPKTVDKLHRDYDVVIIDGTPSLSEMATGIIIASDILIIPILPSAHDYRAMIPFFKRYDQAQMLKGEIPAYFLINQYSTNANVYKRMKEVIEGFKIDVLKTVLGKRAVYVETAIDGKGVYESTDFKAKEEIVNLTKEILNIAEINNIIQLKATT
jgi:chromosome partitioning protein